MSKITIEDGKGTWVVRAGGAILGETDRAKVLREEGRERVVYFPREDIATEFLDDSDKRTTCPHKGEASYFSIVTKSRTIPDAVWSYEAPNKDVSAIAGHLAFFPSDLVTVEEI